MNINLRNIPQVEKLLQDSEIASFIPEIGHPIVVDIIRRVLDAVREDIKKEKKIGQKEIADRIIVACAVKKKEKLQRVINGTGVIIHTNLGRSPLGRDIFEVLKNGLSGYCNLEYHIPSQKRGKRGGYSEELICSLTGA